MNNAAAHNPFWDLLLFEYSQDFTYRLQFNIPEEYRKSYLSMQGEADLELINENILMNQGKQLLIFNVL